jgi:cyclase
MFNKFEELKTIRIIPRLDIKGPNLVKGIHLEGLRVLGSPQQFAKYYYEQGADELFYQDVVASLYDRNSLGAIISATAKSNFIPLTVGGGIRTIEDIKNLLRLGADKVCINTGAIKSPNLINEASKKFGSSTIVVAIEAIKQSTGEYMAYVDNGREHTGIEVVSWAKKCEELGAGEIVITSVDKEGTGKGYDIELIKSITTAVDIPVIAHGGAGKLEDLIDPVKIAHADALCMGSILHYGYIQSDEYQIAVDIQEGNRKFITGQNKSFGKIIPTTISEIKKFMLSNSLIVRI